MFIDTHCHLTGEYVAGDNLDAVIARATAAGVGTLICATAHPDDVPAALRIADAHKNVFCTCGIHPEYAGVDATKILSPDVLQHPQVIGVGEIGLDYHFGTDSRDTQIQLFEQQLDIARAHNMPIAVHTRDAEADTMSILDETVGGVMHCFTGSWDFAQTMLDRGFYFSASGILTFKNADDLRETFSKIPIDRIVIETDAPFCAPVPHRGKTCESAMVIDTARVLAEIHNMDLEKLTVQLRQNTKTLYPKIVLD